MRANGFIPKGPAWAILLTSLAKLSAAVAVDHLGVRDDLHFSLEARASNLDSSLPIYKNPNASIEDRVNDLLPRMTVQEKVAQLRVLFFCHCVAWSLDSACSIQGDIGGWMNMTNPLDDTLTYNQTGLVCRIFSHPCFQRSHCGRRNK